VIEGGVGVTVLTNNSSCGKSVKRELGIKVDDFKINGDEETGADKS
jgi:hypothetical protein